MFPQIDVHYRGRLPHWERDESCYFVTFRLADSLPSSVLEAIKFEKLSLLRTANQLNRELSSAEKSRLAQLSKTRIERWLDSGGSACHLAKPGMAKIVAEALRYFDGQRYRLFAWCVMPNHVHVLFQTFPDVVLSSVLHSWKSFTSKKINCVLGVHGELWEREYYDHLVRNDGDLARVVRYILENPVKARLRDWPWVWVAAGIKS